MFGRIGPSELIVILLIALLVFGPKNLPEIGKGLGKAVKGFRSALKDVEEVMETKDDEWRPPR